MKKALSLLLALAMCLSLCACSDKTNGTNETGTADAKEIAYSNSQEAFQHTTNAYVLTNEFSSDLYEAWRLGVNEQSSYDNDSEFDDFVDEMNIDGKFIEQAVANLLGKDTFEYGDWSLLPYYYDKSYFSAWVSVISEAYQCSEYADQIKEELESAKDLMKQLSDDYSDYEHYPTLKKYFTNTIAFFDFCCNPEGSFEQVVDTFNTYRNNAREYFFDLNYVFSDSIGGIDDYEETTSDTSMESAIDSHIDS